MKNMSVAQAADASAQKRTGLTAVLTFLFLLAACFALAVLIRVPEVALVSPRQQARPAFPKAPDFAAMEDVEQRKNAFFDFLQPFVDYENRQILAVRRLLEPLLDKVRADETLTRNEKRFVTMQSQRYSVQPQRAFSVKHLRTLLRRVDILPSSLVLAQAANESAWGTSRFAVDGNNYFGQWCYSEGCGLVPKSRSEGASHEVQAFDSPADSVAAYFMNVNTFPSYQYLREMRQDMRQTDQPIDGKRLSEGLIEYSERGADYIKELQTMIDYNDLSSRDTGVSS